MENWAKPKWFLFSFLKKKIFFTLQDCLSSMTLLYLIRLNMINDTKRRKVRISTPKKILTKKPKILQKTKGFLFIFLKKKFLKFCFVLKQNIIISFSPLPFYYLGTLTTKPNKFRYLCTGQFADQRDRLWRRCSTSN